MYVYAVILIVLSFLLFCLIRGRISLKDTKSESFDNVLILDSCILKSGLLGFIIFAGATAAVIILKESIYLVLEFSFFCLLGLLLIVGWCNCRIYYNGEMFIVKSLLGITKRYTYSDVTDIYGRYGVHGDVKIYSDKKIAFIDRMHVGNKKFIKLVIRKYRELNPGQTLLLSKRSGRKVRKPPKATAPHS